MYTGIVYDIYDTGIHKNILTRHTLYVYIHKIQVLWEKRINMGKKGKGKKKKGKKPSTADSSKSNASGKGKGKKGKKKKKKKEIEPEVYEFKEPEQWAKDIGMVEFFHGETDKEKFNNAQIFRSYKMPDDHKKPSQQEQHVNIRNMHLRRFPQLQLERGPNTLKMS